MDVDIDARDVVKLVLQFCKESSLTSAFEALQEESGVVLNTVDDLDSTLADVHAGRWQRVLEALADARLPHTKAADLHEQVVLELLEAGEQDAARTLLREAPPLRHLAQVDVARAGRLARLCDRAFFEPSELYGNASREARRARVAAALSSELTSVPPSRLLALLGQALRWQSERGELRPGVPYDVFRGTPASSAARDEVEAVPSARAGGVRFEEGSHAEAAAFSPDGLSLVTGGSDGYLEIWDAATGELRLDLEYQAKDRFLSHEGTVLSIAFSRDGALLASGDADGAVKVWRLDTGQCVRRLDAAHSQGVTSLEFSPDATQLLSASYDGLIRIHGIRSGRTLKELRGHESFVARARFMPGGAGVVSCSADGTVAVWDAAACKITARFRPPPVEGVAETPVVDVLLDPRDAGRVFVVSRGPTAHLVDLTGGVLREFQTGGEAALVAATVSPRGAYLYCLAEDGRLVAFEAEGGTVESAFRAADKEPIGIVHHPLRNVLATFADDAELRLWRPE